ncbi:AfsR/SARP family transcriptional regulator [Streptomyces marianii]|uniref:AfsR/SARP family transcriptional regulator n=1 Tax=Streptomyces marianii TaxID=1817406 RepID=A0A5R9E6V6_9ACTN|nr:AfsR/SARP family transcriptional regulator [Streptomyces marianii]TLQ43753.1 AfsR/SARP family transcriptional regulator [Streptomyces marianii]
MQINMLGPLVAHHNGTSVTPIARKPRQVLSLLALQAGTVVPVPALMEELWGTQPPASALTTLQTYILQVRRGITVALGASHNGPAKDVLRTCYGGYLLDVDPTHTDVHAFERLAEEGKRACERGELDLASARFRQALGLWRGDALVDVHTGMRIGMEVARLEEGRLGALEARVETDLRLGRHASLLPELSALTARHPMHENLWAQFMIALHRSGRTSQALESFIKLRKTLVNELGVEPSARLQHLQHAILRADPGIDRNGPEVPAAASVALA